MKKFKKTQVFTVTFHLSDTLYSRKTFLTAAIIVLLTVSAVNAALITIAIEGTIDAVSDPANHLEGNISVGNTITGYYTYESTTPDSDPFSDGGEYLHTTTPYGIFLSIGGFNFKTDSVNIDFGIGILDDFLSKDSYVIRSLNNSPLSNGVIVEDLFWQLDDSTMTALSSDALPTTAPVLSEWDYNRLNVHGGPRGAEFGFDATVTSATAVPEPVTILFMSLGVCFFRRRIH